MLRCLIGGFVLSAILIVASACGSQSDELVVLETTYGRIVIDLLSDHAPQHARNFRELVQEGFYDQTKFHRLVRNQANTVAIQGGDPNTISGDPATWGQGQPGQRTVNAEFSSTLRHARGIVSAARRADDVNSHTSQFFVCTMPVTQWDAQYSIFGRVIDGMNVLDTIAQAPVWPGTERPLDPVVINRAYLIKRSELD